MYQSHVENFHSDSLPVRDTNTLKFSKFFTSLDLKISLNAKNFLGQKKYDFDSNYRVSIPTNEGLATMDYKSVFHLQRTLRTPTLVSTFQFNSIPNAFQNIDATQ